MKTPEQLYHTNAIFFDCDTFEKHEVMKVISSIQLDAQLPAKLSDEEVENKVDEQWLNAIAKHYKELTGKHWEVLDGETREEGLQHNVAALFEVLVQGGREDTEILDWLEDKSKFWSFDGWQYPKLPFDKSLRHAIRSAMRK